MIGLKFLSTYVSECTRRSILRKSWTSSGRTTLLSGSMQNGSEVSQVGKRQTKWNQVDQQKAQLLRDSSFLAKSGLPTLYLKVQSQCVGSLRHNFQPSKIALSLQRSSLLSSLRWTNAFDFNNSLSQLPSINFKVHELNWKNPFR